MPRSRAAHTHETSPGRRCQYLALGLCALLGLAMIANNQLQGDSNWFWYALLFHRGAKLYADLHFAQQPLFILEIDLWIKCFGTRTLVTEGLSVLHLLLLCAGLYLVLRESNWPDWQKAILLLAGFVLWTCGSSYRFDDYHVTTESFILYAMLMLLLLARTQAPRRQFALAAALGVLGGFIVTSRINDGAAEFATACFAVLFVAPARKLLLAAVTAVSALATFFLVIRATGDTFSDYLSNSVFRAASSKGGSHKLLADPFLQFYNALHSNPGGKGLLVLLMVVAGVIAYRLWSRRVATLMAVQLAIAVLVFALSPHARKVQLIHGNIILPVVALAVLVNYLLAPVVAARWIAWRLGQPSPRAWDPREVLVLMPLALWVSLSTSSGGDPWSSYYAQIPMLLLLFAVLRPADTPTPWLRASLLSVLALIAVTGISAKVLVPYNWNDQPSPPMFVHRVWYRHPVYGPMYMDRDLLQLSQAICTDIAQDGPPAGLLSLPMAYPNYFCDVTPWHGFVQTYYDTSTRASIEDLMAQLNTAPPPWIVYQRQLQNLAVFESEYNHGQPLAQRDLDTMMMRKVAAGEWQLVDKRNLGNAEGWYIIRTRP